MAVINTNTLKEFIDPFNPIPLNIRFPVHPRLQVGAQGRLAIKQQISIERFLGMDGLHKEWENYTFDYNFIGKNFNRIYVQITKNKFKDFWIRNKIYWMDKFLDIKFKTLRTLWIWELLECEIGAIPQLRDLKIIKSISNFFTWRILK